MAMRGLLGGEVLAREARLGELDDLYLDAECWRVRYLVVASGREGAEELLLVSTGCVDNVQRHGRIDVKLSHLQLEAGAGIWPASAAGAWLDDRICSGCQLLGFRIEAQDGAAAGRLSDLLLDEEEWCVDYLVVEAAQPGGTYRMRLPSDWVAVIDVAARSLRLHRTLEEMRSSFQLLA